MVTANYGRPLMQTSSPIIGIHCHTAGIGAGGSGDGLMGQLTRLLPGVDLGGLVKKGAAAPVVKA